VLQEIGFEIGMLGKFGLDINASQESQVLRALPGRTISALQAHLHHVCRLQEDRVGDGCRGVDLSEE
jgi:hypothetical protein